MREVMLPRFLAMLCVLAVFIPSFFMVGISRALFPPLALAVGFSMIASYLLVEHARAGAVGRGCSATRRDAEPTHEPGLFARMQDRYGTPRRRRRAAAAGRSLVVYLAVCVPVLLLAGRVGTELFPRVDTGQFQLRVRAPAGTRLERTEEIVRERRPGDPRRGRRAATCSMTLANIGNPPWTYPVNAVYVWNSGPQEAVLLVALKPGKRPRVDGRSRSGCAASSAARCPDVRFSFEAGDIVSQVLNFGAPTPINVTVSGKNLDRDARLHAEDRERAAADPRRCATCRSRRRSTIRRSTCRSIASAPGSSGSPSIASASRSSRRPRRAC